MAQSFAEFERKIEAVQRDIDKIAWAEVGKALAPEIDKAVRGTLGDQSMSGWKRGAPIDVTGSFRATSDGVYLSAGKTSGLMRVLERGRNQGNAGGMAGPGVSADGTTRRNKDGSVRKVRARRARRWNGTTDGKDTWSHANDAMVDRAPGLVAVQVHRNLKQHLNEEGGQ